MKIRAICFPTQPSVTKIHVLGSGPRQLCSRFPSALLEKPLRVCIPSILLNRKGTCQSKEGPVSSSYRNTCMANSAMVHSTTRNVGSASHNSTQSDHTVTRSSGAKAPFEVNFLAFLYEKGYEYGSINSHRSAISAYHVHIDNNPIGQHPRVCTLMTGIFNNRPPKPRYTFVWDIETVLNYLSELPDNLSLSIRVLSYKLSLLLSLTAASRV